jgi:hypothetical protein
LNQTSGTAPILLATTGVPQAMASIIIRPKGSSQSMKLTLVKPGPAHSSYIERDLSQHFKNATSPASFFIRIIHYLVCVQVTMEEANKSEK